MARRVEKFSDRDRDRDCGRDLDRNVTKSGTIIRVGTTASRAQTHPPTIYTAVGGDSSNTVNTQAQPDPGICGNTSRLKLLEERMLVVADAPSSFPSSLVHTTVLPIFGPVS